MCNSDIHSISIFSLILHSNKVTLITPFVKFLSDPLCVEVVQINTWTMSGFECYKNAQNLPKEEVFLWEWKYDHLAGCDEFNSFP